MRVIYPDEETHDVWARDVTLEKENLYSISKGFKQRFFSLDQISSSQFISVASRLPHSEVTCHRGVRKSTITIHQAP